MYRQKKLKYWRRHKQPRQGQTPARGGYCLTNHYHRSGLEIKVCDELRLRKIAGDILDYRVEVPIVLMDGEVNVSKYIGRYIADFLVEHTDGSKEIIEAKGLVFRDFKKKWAALEKMYAGDPLMTLTIVTQ